MCSGDNWWVSPHGPRGALGGDVFERAAEQVVEVDRRQQIGGEQVLQGEGDVGQRIEPRKEQVRAAGVVVQRGQHRVIGDPAAECLADRGVAGGRRTGRVHPAVPALKTVTEIDGLRRQVRQGGEPVEQLAGRAEPGVGVDRRHVVGRPAVARGEQLADPAGPVRRRELDAERLGQFAGVGHHRDAVDGGPRQVVFPASPGVRAVPGRYDAQPVGRVAARDQTGGAVQQPPDGVRGQDDVDRLHPVPDRLVDVTDGGCLEQLRQRVEADLPGHPRRVAQADRVVVVRAAGDDRAAGGLDHLDLDGVAPGDRDRLGVRGGRFPAVRAERLHPVRRPPELLAVEVLVVGHRVGDRPGHVPGVAEVRDPGDARYRQPDHVVLRAGEPDLLVDARAFDVPVRVAGDQGRAGRRVLTGNQPAVAARRPRALGGEDVDRRVAELPGDLLAPQLGREPGEQDVHRHPDPERRPRLPLLQRQPGRRELRSPRGTAGQTVVDARDVGLDPLPGAVVQRLQAAFRGVGEPRLPGERVPGDAFRPEEGGGGAEVPAALQLDLPGPVGGDVQALQVGERERVTGPKVRNALGIAVNLGVQLGILTSLG